MKTTRRLHLDDLRVDSFATLDHAPAVRGTVHANADVDPGTGTFTEGPNTVCICVADTWDACPSEYRTACEPHTDVDPRNCAVEYPYPTEPLPA